MLLVPHVEDDVLPFRATEVISSFSVVLFSFLFFSILVFCVMFCRSLCFCPVYFGHCIIFFQLPLWYLQTFFCNLNR
jgi:hypothetical protein